MLAFIIKGLKKFDQCTDSLPVASREGFDDVVLGLENAFPASFARLIPILSSPLFIV